MSYRVEYQKIPAEQTFRFFVDAYNKKVPAFEWFFDASKQVVVLQLYIDDDDPERSEGQE